MYIATFFFFLYLQSKGSQNNAAENGVPVNSLKHVPFSMDLAGINLIEKLHHYEDVEDYGVVFRWRGVQRSIAATINVEELLTFRQRKMVSINK